MPIDLPDPLVVKSAGGLDDWGVQRNFETLAQIVPRVTTLEGLLGGTRTVGPFDAGVSATIGQYAEATLNVVHNLALVGAQTIVGQLYDGGFAAGFSWRTANVTSNSFQITMMNLRNGLGSAGWRGYVLIG